MRRNLTALRVVGSLVAILLAASCSSGGNAADTTAPETTTQETTPVDTTTSAISALPDTVPDTPLEPAKAEEATIDPDGRVSWNVGAWPDAVSARRYVIDLDIPDVVAERFDSELNGPQQRSTTAIFSAESFAGGQTVYIVVQRPADGEAPFDVSTVDGEALQVNGEDAVRRKLGVAMSAITFELADHRVDIATATESEAWLVPMAESIWLDAGVASASPPADSGLVFIGALSPALSVLDAAFPVDTTSSATSGTNFFIDGQQVAGLTTSIGRITGFDTLTTWLDARAEAATIAGVDGWIVRVPDADLVILSWIADDRLFKLAVIGADEETALSLAALVRPAADGEW